MAHFAELDSSNIVLRVVVIANQDITDPSGVESEELGKIVCQKLFGGNWVQTSYTGSIRKNFAGIGYLYRQDLDGFVPPKPYDSWSLDEATCKWVPPTPKPESNPGYIWSEAAQSWVPQKV